MSPKVLFIASTEVHIYNFHIPYLKAFIEASYEVHVACKGNKEDIPYVTRVVHLPFEKSILSVDNIRASQILHRLICEERYELICTHTSLAAFYTRLALFGMHNRPKLVNMSHGYLFDDESPLLKKLVLISAERMMAPKTDLLMTMNRYDFNIANRYRFCRKIVAVPGVGVDFQKLDNQKTDAEIRYRLGIPETSTILFYAAEFSRRKNQRMLIEVMTMLPEDVFLILGGEGALLDDCRKFADVLGVSKRVFFPGYLSPVGPWYRAADIAVSSSRSEGLPFFIMEAMHYGLPVVVSDVKGNNDLIYEGINGYLYPFGDASACAEKIRLLLASQELKKQLSRRAELDSENYSLENVFPKVWKYYQSELKTVEEERHQL